MEETVTSRNVDPGGGVNDGGTRDLADTGDSTFVARRGHAGAQRNSRTLRRGMGECDRQRRQQRRSRPARLGSPRGWEGGEPPISQGVVDVGRSQTAAQGQLGSRSGLLTHLAEVAAAGHTGGGILGRDWPLPGRCDGRGAGAAGWRYRIDGVVRGPVPAGVHTVAQPDFSRGEVRDARWDDGVGVLAHGAPVVVVVVFLLVANGLGRVDTDVDQAEAAGREVAEAVVSVS